MGYIAHKLSVAGYPSVRLPICRSHDFVWWARLRFLRNVPLVSTHLLVERYLKQHDHLILCTDLDEEHTSTLFTNSSETGMLIALKEASDIMDVVSI